MEDPANELEGVVRALVDKPTLRRQEKTLRQYFTPDVEFYHPYINTNRGVEFLIAIYQYAEIFLNYSGVDFHTIAYDDVPNCIAVRMTVYIRPWLQLCRTIPLEFHTLLELKDVSENGKILKKIKVQRDYFIRSPILQSIPLLGNIYNSDTLRFISGDTIAFIFMLFKALIMWIARHLPEKGMFLMLIGLHLALSTVTLHHVIDDAVRSH